MIRSMTGYGQAEADFDAHRVVVEARSVNHRFAEARLRLPHELGASEGELRRLVLSRVRRGRVDVYVRVEALDGDGARPTLHRPLLDEVLRTVELLRRELGVQGAIAPGQILAVPGLFREDAGALAWSDPERERLQRTLSSALDALDAERRREGEHLREDLDRRLGAVAALAERVRERAAELPGLVRDRLVERLRALEPEVVLDPGRVAQEAALLAERGDVTEEIVRLSGHVEQARRLVTREVEGPVGKRLDFLLQEMHREINTIGAKSPDLELSRLVLELKSETEKVREQVQNVE